MTISMKIIGANKTLAFLSKKRIRFNIAVNEGVKDAGKLLQSEIEASVEGKRVEPRSILSGDFWKSIELTTGRNVATISSDVKHALFLEEGTTKIPARHHFKNSLARQQRNITKIISDKIKKANRI